MKALLVAMSLLSFCSYASADDFACEIRVGKDYREGLAKDYRGRTAIVELNGYHCAGSMSNTLVKAYLYEPGETDDDDATKSHGLVHTGAIVIRPDLNVICKCGLR